MELNTSVDLRIYYFNFWHLWLDKGNDESNNDCILVFLLHIHCLLIPEPFCGNHQSSGGQENWQNLLLQVRRAPLAWGDLQQCVPSCRWFFLLAGLPTQGQCNSGYPNAQSPCFHRIQCLFWQRDREQLFQQKIQAKQTNPSSCTSRLVMGEEEMHGGHAAGHMGTLHSKTCCPSRCQNLPILMTINLRF